MGLKLARQLAILLLPAAVALQCTAPARAQFTAGLSVLSLGPNVQVFSPDMPQAEMQRQIDEIYATQEHSEFGTRRNAILLLPGEYHLDIPVGFYTQIVGVGATHDAVHVT